MIKNVLILSPHTDDAELGAGGYISKLIREGHNILWVAFSTAEESLPDNLPKDTLKVEFQNVIKSLGLDDSNSIIYNYKVRNLHTRRQEILENLVKIRKEFKPTMVIGPSQSDYHQDHSVVSNEMIRAFKSNCSIICYELPWNQLQFNTNFFVKLEEKDIESKIDMLTKYESQIKLQRNYFSEQFVRGLAYVRGTQVNAEYAEAFEVLKWLE